MCLCIENICMYLYLSVIFFFILWIIRVKLNICFEIIKYRCMFVWLYKIVLGGLVVWIVVIYFVVMVGGLLKVVEVFW